MEWKWESVQTLTNTPSFDYCKSEKKLFLPPCEMLTLEWRIPRRKSKCASDSVSCVARTYTTCTYTQYRMHTKLSKAVKLSRTGPSSSSSFIHQRSTLWPAHPIEQTFILSILQFPQQSSFSISAGPFHGAMCHVVSRSQCSGGAERDTSATDSRHSCYRRTGCSVKPYRFVENALTRFKLVFVNN